MFDQVSRYEAAAAGDDDQIVFFERGIFLNEFFLFHNVNLNVFERRACWRKVSAKANLE
jgi:hypothetical protein